LPKQPAISGRKKAGRKRRNGQCPDNQAVGYGLQRFFPSFSSESPIEKYAMAGLLTCSFFDTFPSEAKNWEIQESGNLAVARFPDFSIS
jgi:hypothetical protein